MTFVIKRETCLYYHTFLLSHRLVVFSLHASNSTVLCGKLSTEQSCLSATTAWLLIGMQTNKSTPALLLTGHFGKDEYC